jgi:hypothetical protein
MYYCIPLCEAIVALDQPARKQLNDSNVLLIAILCESGNVQVLFLTPFTIWLPRPPDFDRRIGTRKNRSVKNSKKMMTSTFLVSARPSTLKPMPWPWLTPVAHPMQLRTSEKHSWDVGLLAYLKQYSRATLPFYNAIVCYS